MPLRRGLFPAHRRLSPIRIDLSVWSYPFPRGRAPANIPKLLIEKIANATRTLLNSPDYRQMLIEMGFEGTPESDAESFRKVLADAVIFWEPVVRSLGLKID